MLKAMALDPTGPYIMTVPWSGCWIWMGALSAGGYANADINGKTTRVSRFMLEQKLGRTLGVQLARHICDVACCVNPEHLVPGNQAQNMRDAAVRGRTAAGTKHGNSKLTPEQVASIKEELRLGLKSQRKLATEYGVSQGTISNLRINRTYRR